MSWGHTEGVEIKLYSLFNLSKRRRWLVIAMTRPLYAAVKRRRTQFSTVGCVGVETVIDGYGNYRLNWISNPESSSPYRFAVPNSVPRSQIFNELAIYNRIPKLIPCYQKGELWFYYMVPPFRKPLKLGLPTLSLCQMHDYILKCRVSFTKFIMLYVLKMWVFNVTSKNTKVIVASHEAWCT
jgi:hypothetical protein